MAADSAYRSSLAYAVLYILLFFCNTGDSSDNLKCFSEKFNSTVKWNVTIHGQEELNSFVNNVANILQERQMHSIIPHWKELQIGHHKSNENKCRNWRWIGYSRVTVK